MKCWLCAVEPVDIYEAVSWPGSLIREIPQWPADEAGHTHAVRPPTPAEMLAEADEIRARMQAILAE